MKIVPRIYQRLATTAALKGLRGRLMRALVVLATGLGKTLTAAFITKKFRAKRVLFLVHNNFILEHAIGEFRLVFPKEKMATYNGMSKNGSVDASFVFATWQTMSNNLKSWKRNHFDLVIVDEAHHSEAETYKPVLKYFTGPKLGITATPDREDEADIRDVFGEEVIDITLEEAIARGWLPRIEYHVITDESLDEDELQAIVAEIHESKKRFTMAEVNRRVFIKKRDDDIADIINGYDEKAAVFCANIPHANRMAERLKLAKSFHSKSDNKGQKKTWDKNQATLNALKNGTIRRVCAVNAFNEGVNVPSVGLVAFCRVTGVLTVFRQQLGRGLRPGKDKLIALDFVGNLERIQLVLEMMNKISDLHEKFTPKEEMEREGYTRQRFEVSGKGFEFTFSDKVVDLMKVLKHCEREFYPTWQEASKAAVRLGIKGQDDYIEQCRKDDHLPTTPHRAYKNWPGWGTFLGTGRRGRSAKKMYSNVSEASKAAIKLHIGSLSEYNRRYIEDPRLPSDPHSKYGKSFQGWGIFLDTGRRSQRVTNSSFYDSMDKAAKAVQSKGINTRRDYLKRYREDPKLPASPQTYYKDWSGWSKFLGKK